MNRAPLFVSYGMGVDSTAVLAGLHQRGLRPDLILFADPGGEMPETYAYLEIIQAWCKRVGFPEIEVVRYVPQTAPYTTLEGMCLANDSLPALSYNQHQCALRFKRDVLNKFLKAWEPGQLAIMQGHKIAKVIGYDDGPRDRVRAAKAIRHQAQMRAQIVPGGKGMRQDGSAELASHWEAAHCEITPLLQEWGLTREDLPALIESVGLPVPPKSSCFFCPARKLTEVLELKRDHRDLYDRAVAIETNHLEGPHARPNRTGKLGSGMGMTWQWSWIADIDDEQEALAEIARQGGKITQGVRP